MLKKWYLHLIRSCDIFYWLFRLRLGIKLRTVIRVQHKGEVDHRPHQSKGPLGLTAGRLANCTLQPVGARVQCRRHGLTFNNRHGRKANVSGASRGGARPSRIYGRSLWDRFGMTANPPRTGPRQGRTRKNPAVKIS